MQDFQVRCDHAAKRIYSGQRFADDCPTNTLRHSRSKFRIEQIEAVRWTPADTFRRLQIAGQVLEL